MHDPERRHDSGDGGAAKGPPGGKHPRNKPPGNNRPEDDQAFELARDTWRQFYHYCLDLPAPTQPEIDARLIRFQHVESVTALQHFVTASLLLIAVGHAAITAVRVFAGAVSPLEIILFLTACGIFVVAAMHALERVRAALHHRTVAMRIHVDTVPEDAIRSMFADATDPAIRSYLVGVHQQGRSLRRAEASVLLERLHGRGSSEAALPDFREAVRERKGVKARELGTAGLCIIVVLLASPAARVEPDVIMPALLVLGAWAMADALATLLVLSVDPWQLRGGEAASRALRMRLLRDLFPPVAIVLAVTALHAGLTGLI